MENDEERPWGAEDAAVVVAVRDCDDAVFGFDALLRTIL